MKPRPKLADILREGERERLKQAWDKAKTTNAFTPLPRGTYRCVLVESNVTNSSKGTPGLKLVFEILEGEHAGRRVWHDLWLTDAAMEFTKPQLSELGIESFEQLDKGVPAGIVADVLVVVRRGDDGDEWNRVKRFTVVGIDPPEPDAFAPADDDDGNGGDGTTAEVAAPDTASTRDAQGFDWATGEPASTGERYQAGVEPRQPGRGRRP
jgi:hypothetical protein